MGFPRGWMLLVTRKENEVPAKPEMGGGAAGGLAPHAAPGSWLDRFPNIAGYMTDPCWPDGSPRKASRLMTDVYAGQWRLTLKEPNQCCEITVVADDPEELHVLLEALLRAPNPPWTVDQWAVEQKSKKRK